MAYRCEGPSYALANEELGLLAWAFGTSENFI